MSLVLIYFLRWWSIFSLLLWGVSSLAPCFFFQALSFRLSVRYLWDFCWLDGGWTVFDASGHVLCIHFRLEASPEGLGGPRAALEAPCRLAMDKARLDLWGLPLVSFHLQRFWGTFISFQRRIIDLNRQKLDYSHTWNVAFFKTRWINVVSRWVTAAIKVFAEVIFYSGTPNFYFQELCQIKSKELWRKVAKPVVVVIIILVCCSFIIFTCLASSVLSCVASTDLPGDCLLVTFFCVSSFDSKWAFKAWKEPTLIWRLPMDLLRVNPVLEWDWSLSFPLSDASTWGFVVRSDDIWRRNMSFLSCSNTRR